MILDQIRLRGSPASCAGLCTMHICNLHHTRGGSRKKSGPRLVNSTSPLPRGMTDYYSSHYTSPCLRFHPILYILYYIATFRLHKVSCIPFYMTAYYMVTLHSITLYMAGCDYMWFIPHAPPISLQINSWWKSAANLWDVLVNYLLQLDLQDIVVNYVAVQMNDIDDIKYRLAMSYKVWLSIIQSRSLLTNKPL